MGLKKLINNIYFLQKHSLEKEFHKNKFDINEIIDTIQYARYGLNVPNILDTQTTIQKLCTEKMSLARFGDGELSLIQGRAIPFQKSSPLLASRLKEVLSSSNPLIGIAIPRVLYSVKRGRTQHNWKFWQQEGPQFRPLLDLYLNMKNVYYSSEVTLFSSYSTETEKFDDYFQSIRQIWRDKDIHLIYGKGIFDKLTHDIFDNAKTITWQEAPSKDAFEQYDAIFKKALTVDPQKLIIIILGPTATILAYDLALKGYRALDLGHIAKSYDYWKKGKDLSVTSESNSFFKPD